MSKSISCADAGKDCSWSATAESEEELMGKVAEHVKEDHKEPFFMFVQSNTKISINQS